MKTKAEALLEAIRQQPRWYFEKIKRWPEDVIGDIEAIMWLYDSNYKGGDLTDVERISNYSTV